VVYHEEADEVKCYLYRPCGTLARLLAAWAGLN